LNKARKENLSLQEKARELEKKIKVDISLLKQVSMYRYAELGTFFQN
jgi:hypothetical protein